MPGLSVVEQDWVWSLWRRGVSLRGVVRRTGLAEGAVRELVSVRHGGIAPRPRNRRGNALSGAEREEISRGLAADESFRVIGQRLGRVGSVIWREVVRNGGREYYRATLAGQAAAVRAARPKPGKLESSPRLAAEVIDRLAKEHSPGQIAARLVEDFPDEEGMRISHETIYRSLYVQTRGALRRELAAALRRRRSGIRRPRAGGAGNGDGQGRGQLADMVPIASRPPEADARRVPGHWEGDTLEGSRGTAIGTLVERFSRFAILFTLPGGKTMAEMDTALRHAIQRLDEHLQHAHTSTIPHPLPTNRTRHTPISTDTADTADPGELAAMWKSLTWDQGKEMAGHAQFSIDTGIQVYFCDPHSPWQRGSNENTNGLIRQYLPKGTDLSTITQHDLDDISCRLNTRPRKTLNWLTPSEQLTVALTP